jgi:hypothetical protein
MYASTQLDSESDLLAFLGLELNVLRQLSFKIGPEAIAYFKAQPKSRGFEVSQRDSCKVDRIRFLSHRIQYGRGKRTAKTACQVVLRLHKCNNCYYVDITSDLRHSHPLERPPPQEVPEAMVVSIGDMIPIGISSIHIIQFIER